MNQYSNRKLSRATMLLLLLLLLLSSFLLLCHPPSAVADVLDNNRQAKRCGPGGTYAPKSRFENNLNTLLSSLASKSSSNNATAGTGTDRTYGLYLCEGDLAPTDCKTCVQSATTDITEACPGYRQAVIWYDYCMVRYSDHNFFGVPDTVGQNLSNPIGITTSPVPIQMVSDLVREAPLREPLMFASNASTSSSMYAMAQCTRDLTSANCSQCLNTILTNIKLCCTQRNGWRYLAPSCWIRYEGTPFLRNLNYTELIEFDCPGHSFPSINANANINRLLSDVTTKARLTGFYNATTLLGSTQLYGLALCRADLSVPSDDCSSCLTSASSTLTTDCSNNKWGTIWYDKCLLRYSVDSFFGVLDDGGRPYCGVEKVTSAVDTATFALAESLVAVAANSRLMFAANETAVGGGSQSSYVLMQCTRDLSSGECETCLQTGMSVLANYCTLTHGWRYLSGSCVIRYEIFPFFDTSAIGLGEVPLPQPSTPTGKPGEGKQKSSSNKVALIVALVIGLILLGLLLFYLWWILKRKYDRKVQLDEFINPSSSDIPFMALAIIQEATSNFSDTNKLGEGGFGTVYKGMLPEGHEIAVKRLSTKSKQGASEFKNEMRLIAKLQHRNLVRILGCCVEKEEKLLIYEYLPHRSLDVFLFDTNKRSQLDWTIRHGIVAGISRGLLYLHEDSLLKIIHRDLKASNILLDNQMNPKISDFGMAKIFETDESASDTGRVVGTLGYMAPEYALDGLFSVKSDIYSFGVLLLEILSGQKNGRSHFGQHGQTLPRRAWQLWQEDRAIELMDPLLGDLYPPDEAIKLIHIGLLCVQENANERPTMSSVVLMQQSEQMVLPQPTQPPTFFRSRTSESNLTSSRTTTSSTQRHSINEVTITDVDPR